MIQDLSLGMDVFSALLTALYLAKLVFIDSQQKEESHPLDLLANFEREKRSLLGQRAQGRFAH